MHFGRFELIPQRRELLVDGLPAHLGSRAFDILQILVEARGELVTKDEIMRRVWPDTVVEENSLQVHMSALRKVLGADRDLIKTLSGRGYRLVADYAPDTPAPSVEPLPATNLPAPSSELIGRDTALAYVGDLVEAHRVVTLSGAGGIGKTRIALEVGWRLLSRFADGVWFIDLTSLSDPKLVPFSVATALGLKFAGGEVSPQRVAGALGSKQVLLILDNCEHVIDVAACVAEAMVSANPNARVLATSREPLNTFGEHLYRLPSLEVPEEDTEDLAEMLRHSAVQLFVTRVQAVDAAFSPDARTVALIAAICRHLDGIPLAIELAAARTMALGVEEVAARLNDRFRLLTGGRRTALPRHQTLRATLDWSYELLAESDRAVLRRLAIFAGVFPLEAAKALGDDRAGLATADTVSAVERLVVKSLVCVFCTGAEVRYRLLETTRSYALEKLGQGSELECVSRRHAEFCRELFERAQAEHWQRPIAAWLEDYRPWIDDLRSALDWSFSPQGDAALGVALTVAAVPLWMHLSLMDECRARLECALATPAECRNAHCNMQLLAALGGAVVNSNRPGPEKLALFTQALRIAESLDDTDYRLRALWGLWCDRLNNGVFGAALAVAKDFRNVAENSVDPVDRRIGDRMIGFTLNFLGDQSGARLHLDRMLHGYISPVDGSHITRFLFDQRVSAGITDAQVLWLQGRPEQALRSLDINIADALSLNHGLSLCNALAKSACHIALFAGDLDAAERYTRLLLDHTARHGLDVWHAFGRCFEGVLLIRRGDIDAGLPVLSKALGDLPQARYTLPYSPVIAEFAQALARVGDIARGLEVIGQVLEVSERSEERWCMAELLRVKGELMLLQAGKPNVDAAESSFHQSLDLARRQGALAWELRSAVSLARLRHREGRNGDARALLAPVYARITEGFDRADPVAARALLESCS